MFYVLLGAAQVCAEITGVAISGEHIAAGVQDHVDVTVSAEYPDMATASATFVNV